MIPFVIVFRVMKDTFCVMGRVEDMGVVDQGSEGTREKCSKNNTKHKNEQV
jgi:hypothetical protein